jgi:ribosomal protein S17E
MMSFGIAGRKSAGAPQQSRNKGIAKGLDTATSRKTRNPAAGFLRRIPQKDRDAARAEKLRTSS